MRLRESKLRKIIRETILEYGGVPNFKDWYAADRRGSGGSKKKSPDVIAQNIINKAVNGELSGGDISAEIYSLAQSECEKHGCSNKVDYVAEKVINLVMQMGL